MAAERLFLDTNVLVTASDGARAEHASIVEAFNVTWPQAGTTLYLSGQVVREYLAVATRPAEVNGLGLTAVDALDNVTAFLHRVEFVDESRSVNARLLALMAERDVGGKQVHDANVVATMLVHGIDSLATLNVSDFRRFQDLIDLYRW